MRRRLARVFRQLPPVARRETRIAGLKRQVVVLQENQKRIEETRIRQMKRPSFLTRLLMEDRIAGWGRELPGSSRSVTAKGKFQVYDFVRSQGVAIPEQLGRWDEPGDIPWSDLPDLVVIKCARGSASRGVLPLRRCEGGWQIATQDTVMTGAELAADLVDRVQKGEAGGPFGAEEFLVGDGDGSESPIDIKLYSFYGDVRLIQLRRVLDHRDNSASGFRYVDSRGNHVDGRPSDRFDPSIEVPAELDELVDVAARLSLALRIPFCRVDLYLVGGRIVFGELTPRPGQPQWFGAEVDTMLGDAWEKAQARVARATPGRQE